MMLFFMILFKNNIIFIFFDFLFLPLLDRLQFFLTNQNKAKEKRCYKIKREREEVE